MWWLCVSDEGRQIAGDVPWEKVVDAVNWMLGYIAATSITDEGVHAPHPIIAEMSEYTRCATPGSAADELLLRARQLVDPTMS